MGIYFNGIILPILGRIARDPILRAQNANSQGGLVENQSDVRESTRSNDDSSSAFTYLIAGMGIGAALSILLAPRSGVETRQWFANKCLDGLETANKSVRDTRRHMKVVLDHGQQKVTEAVEAAREAVGSLDDSAT